MAKITFILGGVRSGKSGYAVKLAKRSGVRVAFIATCLASDKEMKARIEIHRQNRPSHWKTFQGYTDITSIIKKVGHKFDVVIIDCLTLLLSNLMAEKLSDNSIENKISQMLIALKSVKSKSIIVSNEVGMGIVPRNKLARRFRDLSGRINQIVAQKSDKVFFMLAGLPLKIKGK
jgi:adenosylcobinamide kinase/adenosylcobinamide-phosphate guanylyltransferase